MRKITLLSSAGTLLAAGAFMLMSVAYSGGGRIKVYLQNKCSKDVSIRIEYPGGYMNYSVDDASTKPDTFLEGTKIFDSNGKLAHTVSSSSEGTTVVVCQ